MRKNVKLCNCIIEKKPSNCRSIVGISQIQVRNFNPSSKLIDTSRKVKFSTQTNINWLNYNVSQFIN